MTTAYGAVALADEIAKVKTATQGSRNTTLNTSWFKISQLVAAGEIDRDDAYTKIYEAACTTGLPPDEVRRTMASAESGGMAQPRAAPPLSIRQPRADIPTSTPPGVNTAFGVKPVIDEVAFWKTRPLLTHIRDFARARQASPWAVLGVILARTACAIEPYVVLPPLVGTWASLNTYVALVGASGDGKDAAIGAATDAIDMGRLHTIGVGSGQGIVHQFAQYQRPNPKDGEEGGIKLHTSRVLLEATEVDTLSGLTRQQGSATLLAELRRAWNGATLGFAYVDRDKRLAIPAHRYRIGLIVGVQPERAAILLDQSALASGTPQRFLWMPAEDPDAPDEPPPEPPPLTYKRPYRWLDPGFPVQPLYRHEREEIPICTTAIDIIRSARLTRLRGQGDALDGHSLLCRLKTAALLGLLRTVDGDLRGGVINEDWALAGDIMTVSDATRAQVNTALNEVASRDNQRRGASDAERADTAGARLEEAALQRVCRWIEKRLVYRHSDGDAGRKDLRGAMASRDREHFDTAVYRLQDAGKVEVLEVNDQGEVMRCRLR